MFLVNAFGAILLLPALAAYLCATPARAATALSAGGRAKKAGEPAHDSAVVARCWPRSVAGGMMLAAGQTGCSRSARPTWNACTTDHLPPGSRTTGAVLPSRRQHPLGPRWCAPIGADTGPAPAVFPALGGLRRFPEPYRCPCYRPSAGIGRRGHDAQPPVADPVRPGRKHSGFSNWTGEVTRQEPEHERTLAGGRRGHGAVRAPGQERSLRRDGRARGARRAGRRAARRRPCRPGGRGLRVRRFVRGRTRAASRRDHRRTDHPRQRQLRLRVVGALPRASGGARGRGRMRARRRLRGNAARRARPDIPELRGTARAAPRPRSRQRWAAATPSARCRRRCSCSAPSSSGWRPSSA